MNSYPMEKQLRQRQLIMRFLHHHQESQPPCTWMMNITNWIRSASRREAWGVASQQNVASNSVTPSTILTVTSVTSSISCVVHAQLSSIEGRNVKKMKLTVQHPTIDYPTTVSATRVNDIMTAQYFLHRPSNRRAILSAADSTHNVFCSTMYFTSQSKALEFPMHRPPQSFRSTSASCWRRHEMKRGTNVPKFSPASIND